MTWFERLFPDYARLPRSGKFLAWLTFLQGIKWPLELLIQALGAPETVLWWSVLILLVLSAFTLRAAWNAFKYRMEGFMQMLAVYGLALLQVRFANGFFIDLSGVLSFSVGFGVNGSYFSFNFLAVLFIWLAGKNITRMKLEQAAQHQADDEIDT